MEVTVPNIWPIIPTLNYDSEHQTFILMTDMLRYDITEKTDKYTLNHLILPKKYIAES